MHFFRKTFFVFGAGLLGLMLHQADAATTVDIEATRAFDMNSGSAPDAGLRMLAGGWPDNGSWGLMRGMMAFDLSQVPQDAAGIASASLSIFTRKTGFSVTNPEGSPGDMAIKDAGNQEANPDFDMEVATWVDYTPPGGDVSGPVLSTFDDADYKADWPHGTEVIFRTSEPFAQAVSRALADGQDFLYLVVYCPEFEANPENGKHFYRLGGAEGLPVLHVTALGADSDGDGLEDQWELSYFPGDLTALSGNGDWDSDGLTDKGEFLAGSDPKNGDTDGDTISDGAEVVSWRSDPTKTDSDGDGLADQDEIAENPFITRPDKADTDDDGLNDGDEVTAGTDPSNPDTDGDTYEDGLEKTFGSDPADAASVTGSLVRGGEWKVEMAIADAALTSADEVIDLLDNGAGRVSEVQTTEWSVINFQVTTSVDAFFDTLTTYPILENPVQQNMGMRVSGGIFVREAGVVALGYDSHAGLASLFIDGEEIVLTAGAARQSGRTPQMASVELDAGPHDLVLYHWPARDTGIYLFSSLENGAQDTYDPSLMELLPAFDIANVMTEDSDGDGLDDFWENFYFGNLARDGSGDFDGDGLTDTMESLNRANPTKKDTDGDGLEDGAEVNDHQTAPNLVDTDGDAIGDGDEVTLHQTDPKKRDTDDDGISDNIEITLGSIPTDPGSVPDIVVLLRDQTTGRSWLDGSFWSDGQVVTAGKRYQVGGVPGLGSAVRSPASQDPVFAGQSLALEEGSTLRLKHSGRASLPATAAKNATIEQGQANQSIGLSADIEVEEGLTIDVQGENRRLDLSGHLSGSGELVLTGVLGGELAVHSPIGSFSGKITINGITVINEAPGSLGRSDVELSGELWSNAALNFAGKRLTLKGDEVGLQLDHDIYVKELIYQKSDEEPEFNLDGLLGDPAGTPITASWFESPDLEGTALEELVQSNDGDPQGRILFSDDADNDGLPDVWEIANGLDPAVDDREGDGDEDGLGNELEFYLGTDLTEADSDGDGLTDGDEFVVYGTNPISTDSDGDGLADGAEVSEHGTDPARGDTDGDGLTDSDELNVHQTDPLLADTDCDGAGDGIELANGTDPLDGASTIGLWKVRTVESSSALNNLAAAEEALAGNGLVGERVTYHPTINFLGSGGGGNYDGDEIFPHMTAEGQDLNDFVIEVTGKIQIDAAGVYTFGFNTDDGGGLRIDGAVVAEFPGTRGAGDSLGSIDLTAGEHEVRFVMFERGGGSAAELFMATEVGAVDVFSESDFQLIAPVSSGSVDGCDGGGDGDLKTGLQGYWSLDEGGGTEAKDSAESAGDAVALTGQPGWTDGRFGKAADFDGASSMHVPGFYGVGGNNARTISMWIRTDWEVPNGNSGLVGFGASANEQKWHFKIENTTKGLRTENQGGNNFGEIVVNDGQWHHVVSVFPEGGEVIGDVIHYVDGVADPAKNGGLTQPVNTEINPDNGARTFSIGSAFQGDVERFTLAAIDEVAIWSRALTPNEIAQLGQKSLLEILDLPPVPPVDGPPDGDFELSGVVWAAPGCLAFKLPAGEVFDIEYSTNLEDWEVIASGVNESFEDSDANRKAAPGGYYRARRP